MTGTPASYKWGKHTKKTCSSLRASVCQHTKSVPVIESHYCQRDTNKVYLSGQLNLRILYEKYVDYCHQRGEAAAKEHLYHQIFNHEYNISFMKPKQDRCDICELAKMSSEHNSEKYQEHIRGKQQTHTDRIRDRESVGEFVVCFDLQNVFALPFIMGHKGHISQNSLHSSCTPE